MDPHRARITRVQVQRLAEKLQAFYDGLPEDERRIMEAILVQPEAGEVAGYMKGDLSSAVFRPSRRYVRVRVQQGRVLLDADFDG